MRSPALRSRARRGLFTALIVSMAGGFWAQNPETAAGYALLTGSACLPCALWIRAGMPGIPVWPAVAALSWLYYAVPMLRDGLAQTLYTPAEIFSLAATVSIFLVAGTVAWRALFHRAPRDIQPADWMQVGEFKSYGEPYTRTAMSPAFREELGALLGDNYAMMPGDRQCQGISIIDAKALIDGGPYSPSTAKAAGLINRIGYADQIEAEVAKSIGIASIKLDSKYGQKKETIDLSGLAGFMKMIQMLSGDGPKKPESSLPKSP